MKEHGDKLSFTWLERRLNNMILTMTCALKHASNQQRRLDEGKRCVEMTMRDNILLKGVGKSCEHEGDKVFV